MTTIIMLPAPSVPGAPGGRPAAGRGGGEAFASTLRSVTDAEAGPGEEPARDAAGSTADAATEVVTGPDGLPVTVAQIVQEAAGLLAVVGGTASTGTATAGTATSGTAEEDGALATVIDVTARLAAGAGKADGTDADASTAEAQAGGAETQAGGAAGTTAEDGVTVPASSGATGSAAGTAASATGTTGAAAGAAGAPTPSTATGDGAATAEGGVGPTAPGSAADGTARQEAAGQASSGVTDSEATPVPGAPTTATAEASALREVPTQRTGGAERPADTSGVTATTATSGPSSTSSTQPTTAPQPAPPAAEPRPLAEQLGARLVGLRTAPAGEHVLTLRVDPETFGPVRVVAHIGHEGVRIELLGASDQAREALRAALPDLRRDLASSGMNAQLDLDQRGAGAGTGTGGDAGGRSGRPGTGDPQGTGPTAGPAAPTTTDEPHALRRGLDLLA